MKLKSSLRPFQAEEEADAAEKKRSGAPVKNKSTTLNTLNQTSETAPRPMQIRFVYKSIVSYPSISGT